MDLCAGGRAVPVFDGQKWADRYRVGGPEAMIDRSSRPEMAEKASSNNAIVASSHAPNAYFPFIAIRTGALDSRISAAL